jgi:hypothetical protein
VYSDDPALRRAAESLRYPWDKESFPSGTASATNPTSKGDS